tara:strand:+ start:157 stop:372 length:216 start_codon:yes stop_codon:yes gene_type:complete
MSIQDIIDQLKNIKEQAINDDEITKGSVVNALTDLIHDVEGNDGLEGFLSDSDDTYYENFENVDFTELKVG